MVSEFHDGGGIAQVVDAMRARRSGGPINMAVVGLGTGALACRGRAGTPSPIYELDADIAAHRARSDPVQLHFGMRAEDADRASATRG